MILKAFFLNIFRYQGSGVWKRVKINLCQFDLKILNKKKYFAQKFQFLFTNFFIKNKYKTLKKI
jgi:hypothetical protein